MHIDVDESFTKVSGWIVFNASDVEETLYSLLDDELASLFGGDVQKSELEDTRFEDIRVRFDAELS